jgi:glutamate/tyrosine decarboxylase-like PLP-dependent enzyme
LVDFLETKSLFKMLSGTTTPPPLYSVETAQFASNLRTLREQLHGSHLPVEGLSDTEAQLVLISNAVIRATAPTFLGFVTGGVTPAAAHADNIVTAIDANLGVHLPDISIATDVEDAALRWLLELFELSAHEWNHRIFTTGATASNVMGLACARDYAVQQEAKKQGKHNVSVAELGLHGALQELRMEGIQILTTMPHSSLRKAASLVGLGRNCFIDVMDQDQPPLIDINILRNSIARDRWLSIVAVSCGEVNTGRFATDPEIMGSLRQLCDSHGTWLHVDAAFGLLARCLSPDKYSSLHTSVANLEFADSIGSDGHKLLNVPYDCGLFFSKHLDLATEVFKNSGAAYLATAEDATIPSPMNIGIENSRRFRALPVYASLRTYGASGYRLMVERMIETARLVAKWVDESSEYVLLPERRSTAANHTKQEYQDIFMIVLFRAANEGLNERLVDLINGTGKVWMSGTAWEGQKAVRIAVANWQVVPERESRTIIEALKEVAQLWTENGK